MSDLQPEYFKAKNAALYMGLSESYLYNLASGGAITTYHAGKSLLFKRTDIDEFLNRSRRAAI